MQVLMSGWLDISVATFVKSNYRYQYKKKTASGLSLGLQCT